MCAQSSRSKETAIERLVGANVKRRKNEEQVKVATELAKDHARNMFAPPPGIIDLAPLSKAMSTLRAAGRRLEDLEMSKESTVDGFNSTNVEHVMGDVQNIVHQLKERGQLQYKEIVGSNSTVNRLTEDVHTWVSKFTDCQGHLNIALADVEKSNSSLSTAEADRDTYKDLYEKLQQSKATLADEKNSWNAASDEAARRREGQLIVESQRQINELQSKLSATWKREAELEHYKRDSQIKLRQMEYTNKRQSNETRDLERGNDKLRKHHKLLWDDVGSLRAEVNAFPAELSKHARTVANFQQQIEELTADKERDATEIELLKDEVTDKVLTLEEMVTDEAHQTNGLRRVKKELYRVKQDKKQVSSLLRGANSELSVVTRSKNQAEKVASDLSQEKDELNKKLTKSQGHVAESTTRIFNLEGQLENSIETNQEQAAESHNIRESLKEKNDQLTHANLEMIQLSSKVDTLSGRHDVIQKSLMRSRQEAANRTQELDVVKNSLADSRNDAANRIQELENSLIRSRQEAASRTQELDVVKNSLTDSRNDAINRTQELDVVKNSLKQSQQEAANRIEELDVVRNSLADSRNEAANRTQELDVVKNSLKQSRQETVDRTHELDVAKKSLTEFQNDVVTQTRKIRNLEEKLKTSQRDLDFWTKRSSSQERLLEQQRSHAGELRQANARTHEMLVLSTRKVDETIEAKAIVSTNLDHMAAALLLARNGETGFRDILRLREEELAESKCTIRNFEATIAERDAKISTLDSMMTSLGSQLTKQNEVVLDLEKDKMTQAVLLKDREKKVSDLDTEISKLLVAVGARGDSIAALEQEKKNLHADMGDRDAEISALEKVKAELHVDVQERDKNILTIKRDEANLQAAVSKRDDTISNLEQEKAVLRDDVSKEVRAVSVLVEGGKSLSAALKDRNVQVSKSMEEQKRWETENTNLTTQLAGLNSRLQRQVQDRDALAEFLSSWPQDGHILRCFVEHDDREVRLMVRIDQDAGEVHCLVLNADSTCEVRRHRRTDCSAVIRSYAPWLHLGQIDPLVVFVTDKDGWNWVRGKLEV